MIKYPLAEQAGGLVWAADLANAGERTVTLTCVGCGEPIFLRSGPRRQAHFSHHTKSDCATGETALHRLAIQVLAQSVVAAAREGIPYRFPVVCNYCGASRAGDLAQDSGCTAEIDHVFSNGVRPDILIRGSDGAPKYAIEVVVTHEPEEAALMEYRSSDLPVIVVRPTWSAISSMRSGLTHLAELPTPSGASGVELISRCHFPRHIGASEEEHQRCQTCRAPARSVTVEVAQGVCSAQACSKMVRVLDINVRLDDRRVLVAAGASDLKGVLEIAKGMGVRMRFRASKQSGTSYLSNVCECGAPSGDNFVYDGFGGEEYTTSLNDPVRRYVVCSQGHWELISTKAWRPGTRLERSRDVRGLVGTPAGLFGGINPQRSTQSPRSTIDSKTISMIARRTVWGR